MKTKFSLPGFLFFLICGLLVFVVFSHFFPVFSGKTDIIGRVVVAVIFLLMALFARNNERFKEYWLVPFSFFIALTAISVDYYLSLSKWILPALNVAGESTAGWAIEKLESSLLSILIILGLNRLAGQGMESLYIRRGNMRLGLIVGGVAFVVMFATAIPVAEMFFKGEDLSWSRILPWIPWLLVFVLMNASNEELLFRGLFLGKTKPFFGRFAANVVTSISFVLMHSFVDYTPDTVIFLSLQLLPLSLAWGWLMQKTDSIWGSVLFHAAMDIPIMIGIFSTL